MASEIRMKFHTKEVIRSIEQAAAQRMEEAVIHVREVTIDTLGQPGTGRVYTHYFWSDASGRLRRGRERGKPHQASAPGEPPAVDTGELRQSVRWTIEGSGTEVTGTVGTKKKHGKMLEFGTTKIKARPWLHPSFLKSLDKVKQILGSKWFG